MNSKSAEHTMTTRERIIDEALSLFSIHGYKGTSVKSIADAVGIRDSSIYKHFASKREIIDAIVEQMQLRIEKMSVDAGLPQKSEAGQVYSHMSLETLQALSRKAFLFYLQDDFMSRFWRLAGIEQYHNKEIYDIYSTLFFDRSIEYLRNLFTEMIKTGAFHNSDPETMAISFYTPIFFLLSKYSDRPYRIEEALFILNRQIAEFYRIYRK